jgi:hypothetical protein
MQAAVENGDLQTALMTSTDLGYGLWLSERPSEIVEVLRQTCLEFFQSVTPKQSDAVLGILDRYAVDVLPYEVQHSRDAL